jgi:hypothetical protein
MIKNRLFALAILMLLLLPFPARAGDCSGPDDCAAVPDNGTRAAIGGGIVAGILLYRRTAAGRMANPRKKNSQRMQPQNSALPIPARRQSNLYVNQVIHFAG